MAMAKIKLDSNEKRLFFILGLAGWLRWMWLEWPRSLIDYGDDVDGVCGAVDMRYGLLWPRLGQRNDIEDGFLQRPGDPHRPTANL